ncbi:MAG: hypothetical protein M3N45_06940 [Actinomycetota bacterium]|nr:hypothetical protein [Actinomycetota bacterium]
MDGRAGGCLLYEQGEGRNMPRTLTVFELVADTPAAREALRSFMAVFDPLMFEVRYSTPRGETLHPFLPNSYVEARVSPEFMLRLVNVEEALGILQRRSEAPLVLEVGDYEIPENTDSYTVGGSNGDVVRGARARVSG